MGEPASCHIAVLSPELLRMIFLDLRNAYERETVNHHDWRSILLVCGVWNQVASSFPKLWDTINTCEGPVAVAHLLKLSSPLPVNVEVWPAFMFGYNTSKDETAECLRTLEGHAHRVAKLKIAYWRKLGYWGKDQTIRAIRSASFPFLQELVIEDDTTSGWDWSSISGPIVQCRIDSLKRLTLDRCSIPWNSPNFRGLTHLEVKGQTPCPTPASLRVLLSVLGNCPDLEVLCLEHVGPVHEDDEDDNDIGPVPEKVALHSLKSFRMTAALAQYVLFVEHVDMPSGDQMDWDITCFCVQEHDDYCILPLFPQTESLISHRSLKIELTSHYLQLESKATSCDGYPRNFGLTLFANQASRYPAVEGTNFMKLDDAMSIVKRLQWTDAKDVTVALRNSSNCDAGRFNYGDQSSWLLFFSALPSVAQLHLTFNYLVKDAVELASSCIQVLATPVVSLVPASLTGSERSMADMEKMHWSLQALGPSIGNAAPSNSSVARHKIPVKTLLCPELSELILSSTWKSSDFMSGACYKVWREWASFLRLRHSSSSRLNKAELRCLPCEEYAWTVDESPDDDPDKLSVDDVAAYVGSLILEPLSTAGQGRGEGAIIRR